MKEYIYREAAIKAIQNDVPICQFMKRSVSSAVHAMGTVCATLDAIPAADVVEVRHGRWVLFDNAMSMWNVWVCSECGYRRKEGWMHTETGKKPEAQYCENCMAKMDGGVNDGGD